MTKNDEKLLGADAAAVGGACPSDIHPQQAAAYRALIAASLSVLRQKVVFQTDLRIENNDAFVQRARTFTGALVAALADFDAAVELAATGVPVTRSERSK